MKAVLLYYSGSGSTKMLSEIFVERLSTNIEITMEEISTDYNYNQLNDYNLIIFGFPVFGFQAPEPIKNFLDKMPAFYAPKKGYAFATYALYEENCLRTFISNAKDKNLYINGYSGFRGPASDGSLFFPENWKFMFNYEKNISQKIDKTVNNIKCIINNDCNLVKLPTGKWYAPLNQLFLPMLEKSYKDMTKKMRILSDRCINCNYCVNNCFSKCWQENESHPQIDPTNCNLCLKCVHNCPTKAIWLSDGMKDRKRLNNKFYKEMKEKILS